MLSTGIRRMVILGHAEQIVPGVDSKDGRRRWCEVGGPVGT
jgi:hypothetical protein